MDFAWHCAVRAQTIVCGYPPLEVAFHQSDADGRPIRDECLDLMHRVSLQRVDRCSMRHQVEVREPFLDPSVVKYALNIDAAAMVREVDGLPRGKAALRDVYDLYPDTLPSSIRDRTKVPFGEGAGLDVSPQDSAWKARFNESISDKDFRDGQKHFAGLCTIERGIVLHTQACTDDGYFARAAPARPRMDFLPCHAKSRKAESLCSFQSVAKRSEEIVPTAERAKRERVKRTASTPRCRDFQLIYWPFSRGTEKSLAQKALELTPR